MQIYTAQMAVNKQFILGESPCYYQGKWSWVDIVKGELWWMLSGEKPACLQVGQYVGAAIPTTQGNYIALMTTGAYVVNEVEIVRYIGTPKEMTMYQRFNDAKCDPYGRLFAGTMPLFSSRFEEGGALYCLQKKGDFHRVETSVKVSNGLAWTKDGKKLYYIDTATRRVDVFDYDVELGEVTGRRPVFSVDGVPDGMTIDDEGLLWVAIWDKKEVRRYHPETGEIIAKVIGLEGNVSSCCFGGEDMRTLMITTSAEKEPDNPRAGCIYMASLPVSGRATDCFCE